MNKHFMASFRVGPYLIQAWSFDHSNEYETIVYEQSNHSELKARHKDTKDIIRLINHYVVLTGHGPEVIHADSGGFSTKQTHATIHKVIVV